MLENKMREYAEAFGESFPMFQLGSGRTEEEVIEIIEDCLKRGKNAYDLGLVTDDEDTFY